MVECPFWVFSYTPCPNPSHRPSIKDIVGYVNRLTVHYGRPKMNTNMLTGPWIWDTMGVTERKKYEILRNEKI